MKEDRSKRLQFSLRSLFLVTTLLSVLLSIVVWLGLSAAGFILPLMIAGDLCCRRAIQKAWEGKRWLAAAWFGVSALAVCLAIACMVCLARH